MNKVFTVCIRVRGGLISPYVFEGNHYVFESNRDANAWLKTEFPKLIRKYGALTYERETLPGLRVGDVCNVWGEAQDVFVIRKLIQWEPHRWGFALDNGCVEEVAKCHTDFI